MSKIHRKDPNKKRVKAQLIYEFGSYCMLCTGYFERLELHHIIKYEHCHCTNTENTGLLCSDCHKAIHEYEQSDYKRYTILNQLIRNYKQNK